jgi:tight adherence protein B
VSRAGPLRRRWFAQGQKLDRELRFLRAAWRGHQVLLAQGAALAASLLLVLASRPFLGATLAAVTLVGPRLGLERARVKRITRMEEQLEGWVTVLANALESTPSLGEALRTSERLVERPLRDELEQILSEYHLGSPLDRALHAAAERVQSRVFSTVLLTLRIGRNTGGSLQKILHTTAGNLREMARLEGVVRTKTAEGKAQATVISAVPFPLYLGIRALSPGFFAPLETTTTGHLIVAVATVMWIAAALLARRFLAVDV